ELLFSSLTKLLLNNKYNEQHLKAIILFASTSINYYYNNVSLQNNDRKMHLLTDLCLIIIDILITKPMLFQHYISQPLLFQANKNKQYHSLIFIIKYLIENKSIFTTNNDTQNSNICEINTKKHYKVENKLILLICTTL